MVIFSSGRISGYTLAQKWGIWASDTHTIVLGVVQCMNGEETLHNKSGSWNSTFHWIFSALKASAAFIAEFSSNSNWPDTRGKKNYLSLTHWLSLAFAFIAHVAVNPEPKELEV